MLEALIAGETNPTKLASLANRRVKASPGGVPRGPSRSRDEAPPLPLAPSSQSDRHSRCRHGDDRRASGGEPWALSHRSRAPNVDSGHQEPRRPRHRLQDRHRHEPVPFARTLISWAGICPRNDESAGKRRSNRLRKGAPWLKTTLVQCAWAAVKKKDSYLQAQFYRIKARRGPKKAIMAVAASHPAQERLQGADHPADRSQLRFRHHPRPQLWRQRLHYQAVRFAVLLARVRVQLREHEANEDAVFTMDHTRFTQAQSSCTISMARRYA